MVIAANADDLYDAFVSPDALIAWLPPQGMTGRVLEYEFSEGGRYRIELTYAGKAHAGLGKTTQQTDVSTGRFLRLEAGKGIVQSVEFEAADPSFAGQMTLSWSFEGLASGTCVTVTAENVPPGIEQVDHEAGLRASLQNLARFVSVKSR
jgi:uncharacterized protein YndB with AHSA1/START domain